MRKTIEIIVTPEGRTTVETHGFSGSSCQEASRLLERALGQQAGQRLTAEFYQAELAAERQEERA